MAKRKKQQIPIDRNQKKRVEEDRLWDDVRQMGLHAIQMTHTASQFYPHFRNPEIRERLADVHTADQTLMAMSREIQSLTEQIKDIVPMHQDRVGAAKDDDDMMQAFIVGERYISVFNTFDNAVVPLMADLTEMLEDACPAEAAELKTVTETAKQHPIGQTNE